MKFLALFAVLLGLALAENYVDCPGNADQLSCDRSKCQLPDCSCTGDEPQAAAADRPQIVYLTFDDAMTEEFDINFYGDLFMPDANGDYMYTNPNGCPIRATFFVTSKSNDYRVTHKYWRYHHEMAAHSVTHRANTTYWRTLSPQGWADEMTGVRTMMKKFAYVPESDVVGLRAPFLQGGGDEMFEMMSDNDFYYDSSAPSSTFGQQNLKYGRWPYTWDFYSDMDCQIKPCPTCAWPGIWSSPILDFQDGRNDGNGYPCGMTDTCQTDPAYGEDPQKIYEMLMKNFEWSYNGRSRAPIGIYIHSAWFIRENSWHYEGYKMFLDEITKRDDVWIVPIKDGIEYFKAYNLTNDDLVNNKLDAFNCDNPVEPDDCVPNLCSYDVTGNPDFPGISTYYMHVCTLSCPRNFPWLGNPEGN